MFTVFTWGENFFCPPVFAGRGFASSSLCSPFFLAFGIQLAGLFEHPAFSIGVVGWLFGGAMYLAQAIEYSVQTGRALSILFEWLFRLTGFIASESGIDCRVFIAVAVNAAFLFVPTCPATFVLGVRITRVL